MSYKYIIDSSAWMEYYRASVKGEKIKTVIEQESIATSIIVVAELADVFEKQQTDFQPLLIFIQSRAALLPLSVEICTASAKLKKLYRPKNDKFGLVDGIHLATAQNEQAMLLTTDTDFKEVGNALLI